LQPGCGLNFGIGSAASSATSAIFAGFFATGAAGAAFFDFAAGLLADFLAEGIGWKIEPSS
jgi:hypothetical protein